MRNGGKPTCSLDEVTTDKWNQRCLALLKWQVQDDGEPQHTFGSHHLHNFKYYGFRQKSLLSLCSVVSLSLIATCSWAGCKGPGLLTREEKVKVRQLVATSQSFFFKSHSTLNGSGVAVVTSWIDVIWGIWALQTSARASQLAEISCLQAGK